MEERRRRLVGALHRRQLVVHRLHARHHLLQRRHRRHIDVAGRDGLWRCVMSDVQLSVIVADLLAAHTGAFNVKLRVCLIRLDFLVSVFVLQPPSCLVCLAVLCCRLG